MIQGLQAHKESFGEQRPSCEALREAAPTGGTIVTYGGIRGSHEQTRLPGVAFWSQLNTAQVSVEQPTYWSISKHLVPYTTRAAGMIVRHS
jgi:hypothetical protein